MKDFFISYTGADLLWAEWITAQLNGAGYTTVFQERDFHAGGNFVLEMHRAAIESRRTIAVLSERYLDASFTNPEWAAAYASDPEGKEQLIIPVRIEDFKQKGLFKSLIYIDLVGLSEAEAKSRLLIKIAATIQGESAHLSSRAVFPGASSLQSTKVYRFPGVPPPACNLPRRNVNFTGRDQLLLALHDSLCRPHHTALTQQVLYGLGGIGKTQLAIEYAWRNSGSYDVIWWIRAEDPSTVASDYASLARELDLSEKGAKDQTVTIHAVKKWFEHNIGWLIIFDNARDPESIRSFLPNASGGHVLITSRYPNWNHLAVPRRIEVWSREESIAFLNKRAALYDNIEAFNLAETLADLPLALEQAAAYCHNRQKSSGEYLALFTTRRQDLWKREKNPDDYPATVATTWTLAFEEARSQPHASDILNLCSVVASDAVPRTLVNKALEYHATADGEELPIDTVQVDDALELLSMYALLTLEQETLSMHRVIQTVAQERMSADSRKRYLESMLKALSEQFPEDGYINPAFWSACARLEPHTDIVIKAISDEKRVWQELSHLLNSMASYCYCRAAYAEAELKCRRSLGIRERMLGPEHPDVAMSLSFLAEILRIQGKYAESEQLLRRSLRISERVPGSNHSGVAFTLNGLALLLRFQGRYAEAEPLHRRSLQISERVLGSEHPDVAITLFNLALLLMDQKKDADAEVLCRRSLEISEKVLGLDHPLVALIFNALALLIQNQGNFAEAEKLYRRSLEISEKVHGLNHPDVSVSLDHLAELLRTRGEYAEAESLHHRSMGIRESMLGAEHPSVAKSLNNLALLLRDQGKYAEAEKLYRKAFVINEKTFGATHPDTISVKNNLENLHQKMQYVNPDHR
jgi:tetratricopeptide (TPR) repeat protein